MSESLLEAAPWSKRRWFATILILLVAQVSLVLWFTDNSPPESGKQPRTVRIRLLSPSAYWDLKEVTGAREPTLFALVHPEGFSGGGWLRPAEFPYHPTNQMLPPLLLVPDSSRLVTEFTQLIQTNIRPTSFLTFKPAPSPAQFASSGEPLVLRPSLRIEGDLANRCLLTTNPLPEPDPDKILTNCVIAVWVATNGDILSATPRTSSGSSKTDRAVLEFARAAHFAPLSAKGSSFAETQPDPVFGRLIFQWLPASVAPLKPIHRP